MKWLIWGNQGGSSFCTECSCMHKLYVKWHVRSMWLIKVNLVQNQTILRRRLKHDLTHCVWARVWSKLWTDIWEEDMGHPFWENRCVCLSRRCVCVVHYESAGDRVSPQLKNVCVSWGGDEQRRSGKQWVGVNRLHSLSFFLSAIYSSSSSLV